MEQAFEVFWQVASLVGGVVVAAYGLVVSLRGLALGLAKAAEIVTPSWDKDEKALTTIAEVLGKVASALDGVADWIATLTLKLEKPNARK